MTMETRDAQILRKILNYCDEIDAAVTLFGNSLESISTNHIYKNAVAMCILQIGELSAKLTDKFKCKYTGLPWRDIKGMRNLLAHGYGTLDIEELWHTVMHDIPELRIYCEAVMKENER